MTYQVLARKWRPHTFDAVVGQEAITRTLRNALASARIAHAYLFTGPRGVGKTTTARLLARALLCPERTGPEACGECAVCRDGEAAVDVIEIDGASNRGIDEIRTLRENVKYAPAHGRYKVYIIDEVHQLTEAAFNALLKTLEEPPPHVVFVLATTHPRNIPATVLSRVQRFDFRPIPPELLAATLERILREEGVAFEAAALPLVVRAAEGSLRDALSLLDTAIAYGNGRLAGETTAALLGTTAPAKLRAFVGALLAREPTPALEAIDEAARHGEDLQAFVRDAIELLRLTLVLTAAPQAKLAELPAAEADDLRALGAQASLDELLYVLRAFLETDALMRESPHPRVELEIATVRATRRPVPQAIETLLQRVAEAEARLREQPVSPASAAPVQERLIPSSEPVARRGSPTGERRGAPLPASPPPSPGAPAEPAGAASVRAESETVTTTLGAGWARVVEEIKGKKMMLGTVLELTRPIALETGELTVVLRGNPFQHELLADRANRDVVLDTARRYLSGVERLTVRTEDASGRAPEEHPAVMAAIAEFQGEVVAVRPRSPEGDGQ